jgi:transposase InsO family protein
VPRKERKKRRLGHGGNGCARRRPERKDYVWAWDFIHDRTSDGRPLKWLMVADEYTRECLALEVDRGMTAKGVIAVLAWVIGQRGAPGCVRSDSGPEFIAKAIRCWLAGAAVETLYIEPGAPW